MAASLPPAAKVPARPSQYELVQKARAAAAWRPRLHDRTQAGLQLPEVGWVRRGYEIKLIGNSVAVVIDGVFFGNVPLDQDHFAWAPFENSDMEHTIVFSYALDYGRGRVRRRETTCLTKGAGFAEWITRSSDGVIVDRSPGPVFLKYYSMEPEPTD